jgi:hypothetical protein
MLFIYIVRQHRTSVNEIGQRRTTYKGKKPKRQFTLMTIDEVRRLGHKV